MPNPNAEVWTLQQAFEYLSQSEGQWSPPCEGQNSKLQQSDLRRNYLVKWGNYCVFLYYSHYNSHCNYSPSFQTPCVCVAVGHQQQKKKLTLTLPEKPISERSQAHGGNSSSHGECSQSYWLYISCCHLCQPHITFSSSFWAQKSSRQILLKPWHYTGSGTNGISLVFDLLFSVWCHLHVRALAWPTAGDKGAPLILKW